MIVTIVVIYAIVFLFIYLFSKGASILNRKDLKCKKCDTEMELVRQDIKSGKEVYKCPICGKEIEV